MPTCELCNRTMGPGDMNDLRWKSVDDGYAEHRAIVCAFCMSKIVKTAAFGTKVRI